ncbi:MAG: hypothetical protein LBU70_08295 [Chitinispirillales bacterium]|jgi:hypothetical protein|nr:hypothetical protein [Chitinispirillales bacterium]
MYMMLNAGYRSNEALRDIYERTDILRKPISGIVSGYHDLPYIMIAPAGENGRRTAEVTGRISVSPKFILSAEALIETFGEVFDPDTFDKDIEGRIFSFAYMGRRNVKVENAHFSLHYHNEPPDEYVERVADDLMRQEDTRTGLISGPNLRYYPISIDRFISEMLEREFRV